jgi:hypothetical protein
MSSGHPTTYAARSRDHSAVKAPTAVDTGNRWRSGSGHARRMSGPFSQEARDAPPRPCTQRRGKWLSACDFDAPVSTPVSSGGGGAIRMTPPVAARTGRAPSVERRDKVPRTHRRAAETSRFSQDVLLARIALHGNPSWRKPQRGSITIDPSRHQYSTAEHFPDAARKPARRAGIDADGGFAPALSHADALRPVILGIDTDGGAAQRCLEQLCRNAACYDSCISCTR